MLLDIGKALLLIVVGIGNFYLTRNEKLFSHNPVTIWFIKWLGLERARTFFYILSAFIFFLGVMGLMLALSVKPT